MKRFFFVVAMLLPGFLLEGCGNMTIGGHPAIGFESEKDKEGKTVPAFGTVITVHQYGVQTQPSPAPPGTPPTPPVVDPKTGIAVPPAPASYPTIYRKGNDPTIRVFTNQSPNAVRMQIDGEKEIRLEPYQSTADMSFKPGEHRVRATSERQTAHFGTLEVVRSLTFVIRPEDTGWQQIYIGY